MTRTNNWYEVEAEVLLKGGVHARPTGSITDIANQYAGEVRISHEGQEANAKSPMEILVLGIEQGSTLRIRIEKKQNYKETADKIIEIIKDRKLEPEFPV